MLFKALPGLLRSLLFVSVTWGLPLMAGRLEDAISWLNTSNGNNVGHTAYGVGDTAYVQWSEADIRRAYERVEVALQKKYPDPNDARLASARKQVEAMRKLLIDSIVEIPTHRSTQKLRGLYFKQEGGKLKVIRPGDSEAVEIGKRFFVPVVAGKTPVPPAPKPAEAAAVVPAPPAEPIPLKSPTVVSGSRGEGVRHAALAPTPTPEMSHEEYRRVSAEALAERLIETLKLTDENKTPKRMVEQALARDTEAFASDQAIKSRQAFRNQSPIARNALAIAAVQHAVDRIPADLWANPAIADDFYRYATELFGISGRRFEPHGERSGRPAFLDRRRTAEARAFFSRLEAQMNGKISPTLQERLSGKVYALNSWSRQLGSGDTDAVADARSKNTACPLPDLNRRKAED